MIELEISEQQVITTLGWFRTRYALFLGLELSRKADKQSIEEFGKFWIGDFKQDWDNAFTTLCEKKILTLHNGEYQLSEYGDSIKKELDAQTPFYKYEYDNYFLREQHSAAHSRFCKEVYGEDLSQHGLINQYELSFLIEELRQANCKKIVDIGCGNGKITEWISQQTNTVILGVDISSQGIAAAQERTKHNPKLQFQIANLNTIELPDTYDAVLFLDTLYYSNNILKTIELACKACNSSGYIYAYFSQWIMDESQKEYLNANATILARVAQELKLEFTAINLTDSGINHWKKKLDVLNKLHDEFINEGNNELWEYRYNEALRYASWEDKKYARYLYTLKPNNNMN
ncbi:MAG: methyltransferase domain-containing protein [Candidatus Kapabacteria bacterium]|nr:methyltransferase domain-containing protein [Candidatus Kapabacteria bacterium]